MKPIETIAKQFGIESEFLEPYGKYKAKVSLEILEKLVERPSGKYIIVTGLTPTPLGEGKTTTSIGLSMALNRLGKKSFVTIREPSIALVFGIKGGGTGSGKSCLLSAADIDLYLTGDMHRVSQAHNLISAMIDHNLYFGNPLKIDVTKIEWKRVVDICDRGLRKILTGLDEGCSILQQGFDITPSSELMSILALARNYRELKEKVDRITVAFNSDKLPISCSDLKIGGAISCLLRDALKPNLVQTIEETPAFIHTGPFANISHGCSSVIADIIALKLSDYVVTEAGFGADVGFEKFMHIKCRFSGLQPSCAVLVVSTRVLKWHANIIKHHKLDQNSLKKLSEENTEAIIKGSDNLKKMIEIINLFNVPVIVAINKFATDTDKEIELVEKLALDYGAKGAEISEGFSKGSEGVQRLAEKVVKISQQTNSSKIKFLYSIEDSLEEKINILATKIYNALSVEYKNNSRKKLKMLEKLGFKNLPICVAKTPLSLSHNPLIRGVPKDYVFEITDVCLKSGAGFVVPMAGEISTMPGLPKKPLIYNYELTDNGTIVYLPDQSTIND